jgi:hypothetical protein
MEFHIIAWMFVYIIILILMVYILKFRIIEFFVASKEDEFKPLLQIN